MRRAKGSNVMDSSNSRNSTRGFGLESLLALPTVRAEEFLNWGRPKTCADEGAARPVKGPFESDREYRFCRAVIEHPFEPSSSYAKLAGISSKIAGPIRKRLVSVGYLREHAVDSARRGRSAVLLELLPAGVAAVAEFESSRKG
jgi:hypothetical protein